MEALRPREGSSTKRGKSKEPDTFDGSDPKKLNNFILLCNLYFCQNLSYNKDATKVTFALSYLRGMALEYFESTLLDSDDFPDWMDKWDTFIHTLRIQFGTINPTGDAESSIDYLKMQDNQHIVKYNVEFNRLAVRTGTKSSFVTVIIPVLPVLFRAPLDPIGIHSDPLRFQADLSGFQVDS